MFVSDKFADDYQVPFSHPVSQLASCSRRWEAFQGFSDTTAAITSPKYLIRWQKVAPLNVSDRLPLQSRWFTDAVLPVAWFAVCSGRVCPECQSGKLTINLFCRHHGQHRADGVVRRSCISDIFLMRFKCWGWEEVTKRWSYHCFDSQALIFTVLVTFRYPEEVNIFWMPIRVKYNWC